MKRKILTLKDKGNGLMVSKDGTQTWYKDGLIHREDGPAIIWPDGGMVWRLNGRNHRLDGPALELKRVTSNKRKFFIHGIHYDDIDDYMEAAGIPEGDREDFKIKWKNYIFPVKPHCKGK